MKTPTDFKVTKLTSERYDLRIGYDWAIFILGEDGSFHVNSSYGDWAYAWWHHGRESFKHFLIELGEDSTYSYLINKLAKGQRTYFDLDKTLSSIYKEILFARKDGALSKEKARDLYNEVKELPEYGCSIDLFISAIYDTTHLSKFYEDFDSLPVSKEYDHSLIQFVEIFWPALTKILKQEIGETKECTQP